MIDLILIFIVACVALAGFAVGACLGYWLRHRERRSDVQREIVAKLLNELEIWARQYSRDISKHQQLLDSLSKAISGEHGQPLHSDQVIALMQTVIHSNDELKHKLATAEEQLGDKSKEVRLYLAEARTDPLTGLANRRAFDQKLNELFVEYRSGGTSFCLALIDVDHFKLINDAFGHAEGDLVLIELAHQLRSELAEKPLVARFGGEEFAVILESPLRQSAEQMKRLGEDIARHRSRLGRADLTVSIGVSQPGDDLGAAAVVRRADEALYAAKRLGRNRVYFHDGTEPVLVGSPEVVS